MMPPTKTSISRTLYVRHDHLFRRRNVVAVWAVACWRALVMPALRRPCWRKRLSASWLIKLRPHGPPLDLDMAQTAVPRWIPKPFCGARHATAQPIKVLPENILLLFRFIHRQTANRRMLSPRHDKAAIRITCTGTKESCSLTFFKTATTKPVCFLPNWHP